MDDVQKQIYDSIMKYAAENNIPVYHSRKLTPEELKIQQQHSKEIYDFLKALDKFENDSRNLTGLVASAA